MKKYSIGDLVKCNNSIYLYLGIYSSEEYTYHVVKKYDDPKATWIFARDDELELISSVRYIPVPKFQIGDKAYRMDTVALPVIILTSRSDSTMVYKVWDINNEKAYHVRESELQKDYKEVKDDDETQCESS